MLLMTMLDAVYVDTVEEKSIVAIRPKPAFQPLFEIANTREGSDVILINEPPPADFEPEAAGLCLTGRRGRMDLNLKRGLAVLVTASWSIRCLLEPCKKPKGWIAALLYGFYPDLDSNEMVLARLLVHPLDRCGNLGLACN